MPRRWRRRNQNERFARDEERRAARWRLRVIGVVCSAILSLVTMGVVWLIEIFGRR